jgi:hypothetical protein
MNWIVKLAKICIRCGAQHNNSGDLCDACRTPV